MWWFVDSGTAVAWATALSEPLFLAVVLGSASGTELFFVPCRLLAVAAFSAHEGRRTRGLVAVLFVPFVIAHATIGSGFAPWTAPETAHIREIGVFAVASLSAFPGWRFSGTGGDA